MRRASDRGSSGDSVLRAEPGSGDASGPSGAESFAALGAGAGGRCRDGASGLIYCAMGKGERERERLREERIAAEESEGKSGRNRMLIGYAVVSTLVIAIAV